MNLHPRKFPIPWFLQEGVSLGFPPHFRLVCPSFSVNRGRCLVLIYLITSDPEALIGGFPPLSLRPWRNGCGPFKGEAPAKYKQTSPLQFRTGGFLLHAVSKASFPHSSEGMLLDRALSQSCLFPGASSSSSISLNLPLATNPG